MNASNQHSVSPKPWKTGDVKHDAQWIADAIMHQDGGLTVEQDNRLQGLLTLDIPRLFEQYEGLRSSIRFCPNCAHGYEWQESDPAEGLCPGCRRAFRIEEQLEECVSDGYGYRKTLGDVDVKFHEMRNERDGLLEQLEVAQATITDLESSERVALEQLETTERLREGYYVDAQQQRERAERAEEQLEILHQAARDFLNFCSEFQPPTTTASYGARFRALERALGIAEPDPAKEPSAHEVWSRAERARK